MKKRKKKTTGGGSFLKRVQRDKGMKSVKMRIRKKKAELKKLSGEYKRKVKAVSKKLRRKR